MVDWDRVAELRDKGWDWDRIAEDPKVAYQAPRGITDTGRALRTLYAKRARTASREPKADEPKATQRAEKKAKWTWARVGMILTPLFALWFTIAFFVPSPVGFFVSWFPTLAVALAISAAILAFGLLRADKKWNTALRGGLAAGIILGLVLPTAFGVAGLLAGVPTLTPCYTNEPSNFHGCTNPLWTDTGASSGKPVYFFYGSAACPYCSASSWAMVVALERFGSLSGTYFDYSSPTDQAGPSTPETVLANAQLSSPYISLQVAESTYNLSIQLPGFANEFQNAYFVAYDSLGSIPFIVVGGHYYTVGTLVKPSALAGLSPQAVQNEVSAQGGPAWTAISPAADWLTAYILKVDNGQPAALLTGTVLSDYDSIS